MKSDAYATGQALYALSESGLAKDYNEAYNAETYLPVTDTGAAGTWVVMTRSNPIQPYVNSDFLPRNENQFISPAASNWAVLALANSLPDSH